MSELNYLEILVNASVWSYIVFFVKLYTGMAIGSIPILALLPIVSKVKEWLDK